MPKRSAGLLLFRQSATATEVLIAHPGGPFWARKDDGAWSIPKGEYGDDEDPLVAARREFVEELGLDVPAGEVIELGEVKQSGGKLVIAFAIEADLDITDSVSNTFEMEWPPKSGKMAAFPEVDRVAWFDLDTARIKLNKVQRDFLDRLVAASAE
ncbi:putative NUDIX family NTP pyrophosphohydrolase [Williamsia limnetica]|uniref:Putative NUDIX family NTP pyrophosphohydrolase n=1 Tax=Williamsia limnetica TaxID=882452 RepID=A0A318RTS1_WILLI|nr:NUDIX domain-containing protein [Williamsia limnetica]PYE19398.1 putative NUDIX family NTP pyrophosphohydrolase [Williamsia limnetica]